MSFAKNLFTTIKNNKQQIFIVLLIFILAFGVRAHLMKYELLFGFDSYFHARAVAETIQIFPGIPTEDPIAYYQLDNPAWPTQSAWFFWGFTALIYKIFTLGGAYNKDLWILFVKILPALFGALISAAMYFLGKEMYGTKAGITMGLFAAVVPSFVYRTMSGFFEEDSLGFLWLVMGFIFLVKALKVPEWTREKIIYSAVAGVFFAIMSFTWEMFLLIPMVLAGYFVVSLILMWWRRISKKEMIDFVRLFAIAFIIFSVFATLNDGGVWINRSVDYVAQYAPISKDNLDRLSSKGEGVLANTVGEENTGKQYFGTKYNALILFALTAFFVIPWRIFRNKKEMHSLIIFFWLAITFFMAWNKLKFTYTLGLPIAAAAGIIFHEAFFLLKKRNKFEKKLFAVLLGMMIFIGVGAGSFFVTEKFPSIEGNNGWKEALEWMRFNTPKDAKMFNWWDEGHWITFIGERGVSVDNRNFDFGADRDMALFLLSETEEEAYNLVKSYGATHVIISNDLLMKQGSLGFYAYNTVDASDPRIQRYFSNTFGCNKSYNQLTNQTKYYCGANELTEEQLSSFPTAWTNTPNQIVENRTALFIYRNEEKSKMHMFNAASNSSMAVKLWFDDPSITHFKEIFSNHGVKIFKIV